jgi:hypothetical protein
MVRTSINPTLEDLAMKISNTFRYTAVTFALLLGPSAVSANGAADELMAALKACKADSSVKKAAESMIKKSKGSPSDKAVDDFIDGLASDDLIDCIDDNLD